jgi:Thiol:disulfide interchange protein DsbD, N-terminal
VGRIDLMAANAGRTRRTLIVICCCLVTLAGAVWYVYVQFYPSYVPVPPFVQHRVASAFTEKGVHVDIALEQDANGTLLLAGTYTPIDAHVHLYSADLPRDGLNGAGRPTLLELPAQSGVHRIGQLTADQPVILDQFPTLNTAFPIYPDGPVTLRLPIAVASYDAQMTVSVTYMACSSTGFCLPPVENRSIQLTLTPTP